MLTPDNIYRIDFKEEFGGVMIPHMVIFNITQISEEEVRELIKRGIWDEDMRVVKLKPLQLKYLQDKEDKETINSLRRQTIEKLREQNIDIVKVLGGPRKPSEMKWIKKED